MKSINFKCGLMLILGIVFLLPNHTFAQDDKKTKKKVVIIKKTIDKDGNEKVEKIIKEGENIDIDELIKSAENEKGNVEVDVEVTMDGEESIQKSGDDKEIKVTVDGNQVKIMDGDQVEIIEINEQDGTQEIKTKNGKHIVIKKQSGDGEDIDMEELMEHVEVNMMDEGTTEIRIVRKEGPAPDENGAFFGVMIDPSTEGVELLDVVKDSPAQRAGLQRGDRLRSINGKAIKSYEELTEMLSQFKPEDTIEILYDRGQKSNKVNAKLVRRGDVDASKKTIWKTEDGKEIEIDNGKDGKVKKEKIIIKKKIKKEKE